MKKLILASSVVLALGFLGVAQAQSPVGAQTVPQPVVVGGPPASSNVLSPQAGPSASQAVSTLQQTVTRSQTTVTVPASSSSAPKVGADGALDMGNIDPETTDEGTLIRLMSQYQAKLAFENMLAKIEKASQDRAMAKVKFEQEKLKLQAEEQKLLAPVFPTMPIGSSPLGIGAQMPIPAGGMPAGLPLPAGMAMPSPQSAIDYMMQAAAPSVRSIYSFDGQYFAEMMTGSTKTIAKNGTKLPNGSVVVSISSKGVLVVNKGKRSVLTVEAPASVTTSTSTTTTSLTGAPPIP